MPKGAGVMFRAILAVALFVSGCGGGSSTPVSGPIVPITTLRADLKFGYYFGNPLYMVEQADHVNLWWVVAGGIWHLEVAAQLQQARGAGIKNIVLHLNTTDPAELRFQFGKLAEMGYLAGWDSITVYPMDEPDASGLSDADVTAKVTAIRQVMFDTPSLLTAKLGVYYGCASGKRPGIKSFDLVGCFRYESSGCAKLESDYAGLRSQLSPGAKLWLLPGGALINGKEGRQDPACWASYAHRNPDVWGAPAFMWQGGADPRNIIVGIRDMPDVRKLYCETGRVILKPNEAPRC